MGSLYCLMGKSSTGKDTLFSRLIADKTLGLRPVVLYTTRPKRSHEKDGRTYHFITPQQLAEHEAAGRVIERRTYRTVQGDWHYCTLDDGQIDLDSASYLMITVPSGFEALRARFSNERVVPLYIWVDDDVRLIRAISRERRQQKPDYDELCRRFLADNRDFSEEMLSRLGIKKRYRNDSLKECVAALKADILSRMRDEKKAHNIEKTTD